MTSRMQNAPIRVKLIAIVLVSAAVALGSALMLLLYLSYSQELKSLEARVQSVARMVANNSAAGLAFGDRENAGDILQSLQHEADVISADVCLPGGEPFATYVTARHDLLNTLLDGQVTALNRCESARSGRAVFPLESLVSFPRYIQETEPVAFRQRQLGYLVINVSREALQARMLQQIGISIGVFLIALLAATALAYRLQRLITDPINKLADAMAEVATERRFDRHIEKTSTDEFGVVIDAFNTMLQEIKRHESALNVARTEAESADKAKSQFLAAMSHEIRTPMNGVIGMAEILQRTNLDQRQTEYTDVIRRSADALLKIINDVLDFSKIEADRFQVESVPFSIRDCLEEAVSSLTERAFQKGLRMHLLYPVDMHDRILGDADRLRQILVNLISNAIKFTDQGDITVCASIPPTDASTPLLRLEVLDTGPGIPKQQQAQIFDAFTQGEGVNSRGNVGTGLGLAISRQLVELMNGRIGVSSKPGQGSCFWLELPLLRAEADIGSPANKNIQFDNRSALVVLENALDRRQLEAQLKAWKIRPIQASSAETATVLLHDAVNQGRPFNLLLIDEGLSDTAGSKMISSLRRMRQFAGLPAILICFTGEPLAMELETGAHTQVIQKPVRNGQLLKAIEIGLGDRRYRAGEPQDNTQPGKTGIPQSGRLSLSILMAEDNAVNQVVATEMLEALGCTLTVVDNGEKAVEAFDAARFDIILMDCQLPVMDGYQATREIRLREARQQRNAIPIIALTAYAMKEDRERALASGMNDYLSKPYSLTQLRSVLLRNAPTRIDAVGDAEDMPGNAARSDSQADTHAGQINLQQLATLSALQRPGRPPLLDHLFHLYSHDAPQLLESMRQAIEQRDRNQLRNAAHTLKSSSRNLGADTVADHCFRLEKDSDSASWQELDAGHRRLQTDLSVAITALGKALKA